MDWGTVGGGKREWGGGGQFTSNLGPGWTRITPHRKEGFQVSERDSGTRGVSRGVIKESYHGVLSRGVIKGLRHVLNIVNLYICTCTYLLHQLINDQTLPSILAKMPPNDWRQRAKERPMWMRGAVEEAFWAFVDQRWRDALNMVAAEPTGWSVGSSGAGTHGTDRRGPAEATKKLPHATINVAAAEGKPPQAEAGGRRCIFVDVLMRCSGLHPPWKCGAFGNIQAEEKAKIIEENRLCAFCLLHDRAVACRAKEKKTKPACGVAECEGRHAIWLHELLKDIYGEKRVHLVQGGNGWRTPEGAWMVDGVEEEDETMFMNTVQQEGSDWREPDDSWLELNGGESGEMGGVYCIGACLRESPASGTKGRHPPGTLYLSEEEGAIEAGWWSLDPLELQPDEEDEVGAAQYLISLLMGGSSAGSSGPEPAQTQAEATPAPSERSKKKAAEEGDHSQGEIQGGKLPLEREPKGGAPRGQEACNEGVLRERPLTRGPEVGLGDRRVGGHRGAKGVEGQASTGSGTGEANAGDMRGPWGRYPWWPGSQEEGGSSALAGVSGQK